MKNPNDNFITDRLKSLQYPLKGIRILVASENSIKLQLLFGFFVSLLGFYINISPIEWLFQCLAIALVLLSEVTNTAIEKIANFIHPSYHKKIGEIKDIAAVIPTIAALFAIIVGLFIYLPKFL